MMTLPSATTARSMMANSTGIPFKHGGYVHLQLLRLALNVRPSNQVFT